jgi:WD40 repeat protein
MGRQLCSIRVIAAFALGILGSAIAPAGINAQQAPDKPKGALDIYGDALPEGAIARLGTVRFRQGEFAQAAAFAPGGKILASVGRFRGVSLLDADTGRHLHELVVHRFTQSLAFSDDGKQIAAGLSLIDVASGKEVLKFKAENDADPGFCVAFSPDGTMVASGGFRRKDKIIFWDAKTGQELRHTIGHADDSLVRSIAFTPKNGKLLASASTDKTVRLWDVASAKQVHRLEGHEKPVFYVAFALDGKSLISVSEDGAVWIWDVATGKPLRQMKTHAANMPTFALSPDRATLASAGFGGVICLCDLKTGKEIRRWETLSRNIASLAFAPDGKRLVSTDQGTLRQWDTETGKEINPVSCHRGGLTSLKFASDAKTLLSLGHDKLILEWDITSREKNDRRFGYFPSRSPDEFWSTVDLSPDAKIIAQTSMTFFPERKYHPVIHLWDTATGKERLALSGHKDRVHEINFSPNGKLLASCGTDGIRLWNVESGKELYHLLGNGETHTLAFSPAGQSLVSTGSDGMIRFWNAATGKETHRWQSGQTRIDIVAFSPDGRLIATRDDRIIQIWDAQTGKQLARIGSESVYALAFSPTGRILAGGWFGSRTDDEYNAEGAIQLWEVHSGQEIRQIKTPHFVITALAFTPDGRTLASGGSDATILLWDLAGQANAKPQPLTPARLDQIWADLRADAAKADRALWTLALAPQQGLPFLQERLRTPRPIDEKQAVKLIADLESANFNARQGAERTLIEQGESAEPILRKRLAGNPPLELQRRIESILSKRDPDILRQLRAIDTLQEIGTPAARQVLEELMKATANPRVRETSEAALKRMTRP